MQPNVFRAKLAHCKLGSWNNDLNKVHKRLRLLLGLDLTYDQQRTVLVRLEDVERQMQEPEKVEQQVEQQQKEVQPPQEQKPDESKVSKAPHGQIIEELECSDDEGVAMAYIDLNVKGRLNTTLRVVGFDTPAFRNYMQNDQIVKVFYLKPRKYEKLTYKNVIHALKFRTFVDLDNCDVFDLVRTTDNRHPRQIRDDPNQVFPVMKYY